jgi:predicted O-methyltransferase YrrM
MEYLFTVASIARQGVAEIGRLKGGSCFLLACAAPNVPIYSVDIDPQNDEYLREMFARTGVGSNVELIVGDSQNGEYPDVEPIDVLFIDGNHSYEGCMNDLINWYKKLSPNGHLLLHDCYDNEEYGVQRAVVDFMKDQPELQIVQSPFIGRTYWQHPAGSLAHLIRRVAKDSFT